MKKIFSMIFILLGILSCPVLAQVSIDDVQLDANRVFVTGKAEKSNEYVTLVIRNKDTNQLMTVSQVKTKEDKSYKIDFEMPEIFKNELTDGIYNVVVNLSKLGGDKATDDFLFVRESVRSEILNKIKSGETTEIVSYIKSDNLYAEALEAEKIFGDRFVMLEQADGEYVIASMLEGKDLENIDYSGFADDMNFYISFCELRSRKDVDSNLKTINPKFKEKLYSDMEKTEQEYITEIVKQKISGETYEEFLDKYNDFGILCEINLARYTDIENIMSTYKNEIGLEGNAAYTKYNAFSPAKKQKANELIVEALANKVYSYADYITVFETKVDEIPSGSSGSGGGNGGGGSSTSKNTYYTTTIPSNSALRADLERTEEMKNVFDDIDDVEWAKDEIRSLAAKEIVNGRGNNKFEPHGLVTREEFVKMVVSAAEVYDSNAKTDFTDVISGSWYESYVGSAFNNGFVKGQSENVFGVGQAITRQDVCVIVAALLNGDYNGELNFSDNDAISDYAKESVRKLTAAGIVSGMGDGSFKPLNTCTRAQAAKIIYGILERR